MHAACCGPNMWTATAGSATVNINGKAAHRKDDAQKHCGGSGKLIVGSADDHHRRRRRRRRRRLRAAAAALRRTRRAAAAWPAPARSREHLQQPHQQQRQRRRRARLAEPVCRRPPNNATPGQDPNQPPQKAAAQWKTVWSDDQVARVQRCQIVDFEGPRRQERRSTAAPTAFRACRQNASYAVTIVGATTIQGTVNDADGKPVAGGAKDSRRAHLRRGGRRRDRQLRARGRWRAWSRTSPTPPTSSPSQNKARGQVRRSRTTLPMAAGVRAVLRGDAGTVVTFTSDAQGKYSVEGLLPGEGYHIEVVDSGPKRR